MNISLIVIRCQNIERSKIFYEQFGLSFVKEKHGNGPQHYSVENDDGVVFELYPSIDNKVCDDTRLGFKVDDIQDILGATKVINSYDFNEKRVYVIADPDGRKVEISTCSKKIK